MFLTKAFVEAGEEELLESARLTQANNHSHLRAQDSQDRHAVAVANGDDAMAYPKAEQFQRGPSAPRSGALEGDEREGLLTGIEAESTEPPLLQRPVPH